MLAVAVVKLAAVTAVTAAAMCWCYFACFVVPERRLCAAFGGRTMPQKVFPYLDEFLLCHVDNSCTGAKISLSLIRSFAGM